MNRNYVFVIAGNREEFEKYRKEKFIKENFSIKKQYIYVGHEDTLRGWRDIHGVFIGTWKSHSRIKDILHQLSHANNKGICDIIGIKNYYEIFDIDKWLSVGISPAPLQPNWVPAKSSTV